MAGLLQRTAQQSAQDKWTKGKNGRQDEDGAKVDEKKNQDLTFEAKQSQFPSLLSGFFHSRKGSILVIPGGYGQEATQQWREHPQVELLQGGGGEAYVTPL